MANIKIPRGEIGKVSIGRNTNFMDAMSQSGRAVSSSFDSLTASLSNVATAVNANKRKIREQEIDNKNSLMETNLKTDVADFKFKIKEDKTLNTEGDYLKAWEKFEKEMITKYKKEYANEKDSDAWDRFQSIFSSQVYLEGKKAYREVRGDKILKETAIIDKQKKTEYSNDVSDLPVDGNIWLAFDVLTKKEDDRQKKSALTLGSDVYTIQDDIKKEELNVWKKISKFGNTRVDPMDDTEYANWQQIIKNIKTGKLKNWGGKTLTDAHKKELLDWAEAEMKDHKTFVTDRNTRLNTENSKPINEIINKWRSNLYHPKDDDGKALDQRKAIEKMIFESKLTDSAKEALYTEVRTIANDKASGKTSDTDSYGSVSQVDKYFKEIILGQSGGQEWLLTLQEDNLISAKGREWLLDKRDKWTTKIDERQKGVIKEYLDKYDGNIDRLSETTLQAYQDYPHFATIFDGRKQQIRATLFELLAEGEKAGISYYSMMEDINSEYYIPFKLDEIYAESWSTISAQLKQTEEFDVATYWQDKQNEALSYFVDADPDTVGQQLYSKYESVATDFDMQQVPAKDATVAVFYKRWLDMPRPPKAVKSDGSKIPINEYENSEEYKKYRKDWIQWWEKGDWNSPNIPKKYKTALGFEDLSKISEK